MNVIKTPAPIAMDLLKQYFVDSENTTFDIDYSASSIKGTKLLTYMSNLDVPFDISVDTQSEFLELLVDYMGFQQMINVSVLERGVIELMLVRKGIITAPEIEDFCSKHSDLIDAWVCMLDSCTLYNMYIYGCDEFNEFVESFPESDTTFGGAGINFVNLLKHEHCYSSYSAIDQGSLQFYREVFNNKPLFRGKSLYDYWANVGNPLFLLTAGIAAGIVNTDYTIMPPPAVTG